MKSRTVKLAVAGVLAAGLLAFPVTNAFADGNDAAADQTATVEYIGEPLPLLELVSAGGTGRIYSLDGAEVAKAVNNHGMSLQTEPIGYFPRNEQEDTTAMYRLKRKDDSKAWIFVVGQKERDKLLADGWIEEGTTGYVFNNDDDGRIAISRFTNGSEWRLAPDSQTDALIKAGYTLDGPSGYVYPSWPNAG